MVEHKRSKSRLREAAAGVLGASAAAIGIKKYHDAKKEPETPRDLDRETTREKSREKSIDMAGEEAARREERRRERRSRERQRRRMSYMATPSPLRYTRSNT